MNRKIALAAALLLLAGNAAAQTATSTVTVQVESRAITLANVAGLNFGTILPYGSAGSVTVGTTGSYSASNAYISNATGISASAWAVTGIPGAPYAVTLPNSVTITNGSETMTVNGFTRSGGTSQLNLDAAGNGTFTVGARLNVGANQPAGTYAGTFNVTVNYN
jgi:spore coat protein U-like protein